MELKNYREINKGCLKSAFTVVIPEWGEQEIEALYFEKSDGSGWVNYAPKEYVTQAGQKKSYNMVRWNAKATEALNKAIREKIKTGQMTYRVQQQAHNFQSIPSDEDEKIPF